MIDRQTAEQEISWLGARLREPSTYAGVGVLLGLLHFADVSSWVAAITSIGVGVGGIIAIVMPEAKAKTVIAWLALGSALALAAPAPAHAQTASKAPPAVAAVPQLQPIGPYPTNGCGFYYGVDAMTSAAPITGAPVGATAIGGDLGGLLGYTCTSGATFWFAEVMADFQNLNGSQNGLALTGPAHLEQRVGFGSPLNGLLPSLPGVNLQTPPPIPGLPAGVTAGSPAGYVYAAINEDDISATFGLSTAREWLISPEFGVGMKTHLSNNAEVDTWAGVKLESNGLCLGAGGGCPKLSAGPVAGVAFEY